MDSSDSNPYSTPQAESLLPAAGVMPVDLSGCWREGKNLVVPHTCAALVPVTCCIHCCAPATAVHTCKGESVPALIQLLPVVSLLLMMARYFLAGGLTLVLWGVMRGIPGHEATVRLGLCQRHQFRRRIRWPVYGAAWIASACLASLKPAPSGFSAIDFLLRVVSLSPVLIPVLWADRFPDFECVTVGPDRAIFRGASEEWLRQFPDRKPTG